MNTTIKQLLTGRGILSLLLLVVGALNAAAFDYDGITYQVISEEEHTCSVTKCPNVESITIPESVQYMEDEYTVIGIEENALLYYCYELKSLTISNTLQYYRDSKSVTELNLDIDDIAAWCEHPTEGLENLIFVSTSYNSTDDVSYYVVATKFNLTFRNAEITNLIVPMGVQTIAPYAFCGVQSIKSITFPDGITSIEDFAFAGTELEGTLKLPQDLKQIGAGAFCATNISDIKFPANLTEIGANAFSGNKFLATAKLPESLDMLGENVFSKCTDLKEIEICGNITDIPTGLCRGCTRLKTVIFAQEPTHIGDYSFANTVLEDLDLGNRLESIGDKAFASVTSDIKIPISVKNIGKQAFTNSGITSIYLPNTSIIGAGAFSGCSELSEVKLGNSITRLEEGTFNGCPNLTAITLPDSLTYIGPHSLDCYRLSFQQGLTMIDIPDNVTEIGEYALPFGLTKLHIGKGIQSIAKQFINSECAIICDALTPPALGDDRLGFTPQFVLVPEGAGQAYRDNNRWSEYRIIEKNGVKAVVHLSEPGTLASEIRMQSGQFPANVTNLVVTGPLNDDDFAIMRSNMTACYDIDLSKVTNTSIPAGAFADKSILSNIVLPEATEIIGSSAFSACKLLGIDHFPESLTSIGANAFDGCSSLSGDLTLPESLGEIGASAFNGCLNLTSCNLEKTDLTEINASVFAGCSNLTEVRLPESITKIGTQAFSGSGIRSINLPGSLSEIDKETFKNCGKLSSIELPAGIRSLGESVFAGAGLVWITIPESIANIPQSAFSGCKNLMVVNFPASLRSIKTESFSGCTNMAAISSPAQQPATIGTNGFNGIDNYSCSLSIPTTSFTKYLIAEYWGAFVDIRNNIEVAVDKDIDVTYIDEADYQEMMEEEAEGDIDAARPKRSAALRAMREAGVVSAVKGYGRLFNGASLFVNEDASTRFFINTTDVPDLKVVYDGRDITSQIDPATNSFVIDGLLKPTLLEITGTQAGIGDGDDDDDDDDVTPPSTGIEEVSDDSDTTGSVEYYDLNGLRVQGTLAPGIYIRRQGSNVSKIYVR